MPHRAGDPLPCMTENQVKVVKAYGCIPVWLDRHENLVCTFCNSGKEGCASSCLQAQIMKNLRADVDFLDQEESRSKIPLTFEEISSNFHRFCYHPDVAALVNADSLYFDFMERHKIILILQNLSEWLKKHAEKYAEAGGVHNQPKERLWLKCNKALSLFLRLEVDSMTEEDSIILSNIMECSCPLEMNNPPLYAAVQKLIDLVSIIGTFKEIRGHQESLEALILDKEALTVSSNPEFSTSHPPQPSSQLSSSSQSPSASSTPFSPQNSFTVSPSSNFNPFSSPGVSQSFNQNQFDQNQMNSSSLSVKSGPLSLRSLSLQATQEKPQTYSSPTPSSLVRSATRVKRKFESTLDDTGTVRRCMGKTQSGARCKLTEESVHRLHGRCAEAAKSLLNGSNYCLFHRAQENNSFTE